MPRKATIFLTVYAQVSLLKINIAGIAQLVEQRIRNAQVVGSSPIPSSTQNPLKR